jgi:hypothetical protein
MCSAFPDESNDMQIKEVPPLGLFSKQCMSGTANISSKEDANRDIFSNWILRLTYSKSYMKRHDT